VDPRQRTAIATGAGRGIGREIALGLPRAGARVAVLARSRDQVLETVRLVHDAGGEAIAVPADVTDPAARADAVRVVADACCSVDILVNNAAVVAPLGSSAKIDIDEWAAAVAVIITAVAALTFAVLPGMIDRDWGRIVNISTSVAKNPPA
jgi:NADP-dependent 3-hydroxy acid dehydrogenase YdfG